MLYPRAGDRLLFDRTVSVGCIGKEAAFVTHPASEEQAVPNEMEGKKGLACQCCMATDPDGANLIIS